MLTRRPKAAGNMQRTFFDVVVDHANRGRDRVAIVSLAIRLNFFRKLDLSHRNIWNTVRDAGVTYGSKVGIALPSGLESVIATVAVASHATFIPFNPRLTQSEFEQELSADKPGRADSPRMAQVSGARRRAERVVRPIRGVNCITIAN